MFLLVTGNALIQKAEEKGKEKASIFQRRRKGYYKNCL